MSSKGKLFIISAPSGAGKTTLCQNILSKFKKMKPSISYTTRPPRPGEKNKKDYFFVSEAEFKKMRKQGEFIESAVVHGYLYGQSKILIESTLSNGLHVLANVDVQGAKTLKKIYPDSVMIFIHPPSFEALQKRLQARKSDSLAAISKRLKIAKEELKAAPLYDYEIVNDNLYRALLELCQIIQKHA